MALIGWVWCVPGAWWVQRPQKGEILNSACREIPLQFGVSQGILGTQWVSWGWYWTCASLSFSDDKIIVVLKKVTFFTIGTKSNWKITINTLIFVCLCLNLFVYLCNLIVYICVAGSTECCRKFHVGTQILTQALPWTSRSRSKLKSLSLLWLLSSYLGRRPIMIIM